MKPDGEAHCRFAKQDSLDGSPGSLVCAMQVNFANVW